MDQLLQLCHCKITKLSHSNIQCTAFLRLEAQSNAPSSLYRRTNYMIRLILGLQKIKVSELDEETNPVGAVLKRKHLKSNETITASRLKYKILTTGAVVNIFKAS